MLAYLILPPTKYTSTWCYNNAVALTAHQSSWPAQETQGLFCESDLINLNLLFIVFSILKSGLQSSSLFLTVTKIFKFRLLLSPSPAVLSATSPAQGAAQVFIRARGMAVPHGRRAERTQLLHIAHYQVHSKPGL